MTVLKSDLAAWQSARTLADLGELTARWIEGDLASQPGYCGPSDIEDPALIPLLARLNRAGFMTTGSQAAFDGTGYDGTHWQQRAAVEGFTDSWELMDRLRDLRGIARGFAVIVHRPETLPRWRYHYERAAVVTMRDDRDYTRFGAQLPRRHIRDSLIGYGICHPDAVKALCSAWQVTVIDLAWGRPDALWRALEGVVAADPQRCPYPICHHNHPELQRHGDAS